MIACPSSSPRLLEEPADPQAPTGWVTLGAVGPGQPGSPPFHPHSHSRKAWQLQGSRSPQVIQEVSEAPGSTGQTIYLIPNQVLEQLTMKSASPRASHGQRKILGTCPAIVYGLLRTGRRRDTGQLTGTTRAHGAGGSCKLKTASAGRVWQTGTIRAAATGAT